MTTDRQVTKVAKASTSKSTAARLHPVDTIKWDCERRLCLLKAICWVWEPHPSSSGDSLDRGSALECTRCQRLTEQHELAKLQGYLAVPLPPRLDLPFLEEIHHTPKKAATTHGAMDGITSQMNVLRVPLPGVPVELRCFAVDPMDQPVLPWMRRTTAPLVLCRRL